MALNGCVKDIMFKVLANTFSKIFDAIEEEIPYDKNWSDGVGFHPHAAIGEYVPKLNHLEAIKSISPGKRRIIIFNFNSNIYVIYDRFCSTEKKQGFTYNSSKPVDEDVYTPANELMDNFTLESFLSIIMYFDNKYCFKIDYNEKL